MSVPFHVTNVIVLDNVEARYAEESAVLNVCRASFSTALHALADSKGSARRSMRRG